MSTIQMYHPERLQGLGAFYLASPYSGSPLGRDMAYQLAVQAAAGLTKRGLIVFSPIVHSHALVEFSSPGTLDDKRDEHQFWMDLDEELFYRFDGLIVAAHAGWRTSKGVQTEIGWAKGADMPIWTLVAMFDNERAWSMLVKGLLPEGIEGVFKVNPATEAE